MPLLHTHMSLTSAPAQRYALPSLPSAVPAAGRARSQRCQPPSAMLPSTAELLLATLSTLPGDTGLETFEPQLPGPGIAIAAALAATPPVLFWARIFLSAQRRQQAIDAEQAAEQERQRQREVRLGIRCGWPTRATTCHGAVHASCTCSLVDVAQAQPSRCVALHCRRN